MQVYRWPWFVCCLGCVGVAVKRSMSDIVAAALPAFPTHDLAELPEAELMIVDSETHGLDYIKVSSAAGGSLPPIEYDADEGASQELGGELGAERWWTQSIPQHVPSLDGSVASSGF